MLDAHQHFWEIARGDHEWVSPDYPALYGDFGPRELEPLMKAAGVTHTVLVQAAETEDETDYLLDIAERTDFILGVVGWLDLLADDFGDRLDHYRAKPKWVGVRPMLQSHEPSLIADPRFGRALKTVAQRGVPFDILTFPRHLPAMIEALRAAPGVHGIIDHISKPDMTGPLDAEWCAAMAALAAMPDIHCKVSGLPTEAGGDWTADRIRPFVEFVAKLFGPKRLVFGSDWPVCRLAASYDQVVELAKDVLGRIYGAEDMQAIMETNGRRFYRLGEAAAR
ncbi:MAG: amidohydrolase family protein [Proteobacteria bacterium]|nr:amidohydrolase family protein [Pseudomonadota bacterium]